MIRTSTILLHNNRSTTSRHATVFAFAKATNWNMNNATLLSTTSLATTTTTTKAISSRRCLSNATIATSSSFNTTIGLCQRGIVTRPWFTFLDGKVDEDQVPSHVLVRLLRGRHCHNNRHGRFLEQRQQQHRTFTSSSSGSGSGGGSGRGRSSKTKGLASSLKSDDTSNNSNNKDDDTVATTTSTSSSSSNNGSDGPTIVVPTKLPFGESSPRLPHLLALPLVSRPLFPGLITSITITDERTIDALDELHTRGNSYLACFLRSKHSTGVVSDTGLILPKPEVITDSNDLHRTGTFAQIQRLTRGVVQPKPTEYKPDSTTTSSNNKNNNNDEDEDDSSSTTAATLILLAHRRLDLISVDNVGPPIDVTVHHWPRMDYTSTSSSSADSIRALSNEIISTIREVAQMNVLFRENLSLFPMRFDANDPYRLADFAASISATGTPDDLQEILAETNPEIRLQKALLLLVREREVSKLQKEISAKVEEKMTDAQRKYFLTEQLKSIKKELGMERDDKDAIIEKYRNKIKECTNYIPKDVLEVMESELDKFHTLERNSAEFNVTRTYLDWLIMSIPWNVTSIENYDITNAKQVLDRDHYGMDDIKHIILQFIAIGKLRNRTIQNNTTTASDGVDPTATSTTTNTTTASAGPIAGKILCLAGPPGTGKTSIAQSIAAALQRKFYRFSVGGLSDVSEIKGHRRTYIGAMPGKIIQCLKSTGTMNAVCLIDEIDKLGHGSYRGDPSSALLEVLDPSQNSTFRDHFMDVPIDISKILFICTANEIDRIPGPLLDRMEIVRLSGYDVPEKITIAEQFLVPKSMRDSGLMIDPTEPTTEATTKASGVVVAEDMNNSTTQQTTSSPELVEPAATTTTPLQKFVRAPGVPESLSITHNAIKSLVRWYAREAGVRNLQKYIDKITRKLALQVVAEMEGTNLPNKMQRTNNETWIVDEDNLSDYVGKAVFTSDRLYETGPLPSGIVMGLAYTSMGGTALYIETQGIKRSVVSTNDDDDDNHKDDGDDKNTRIQPQRQQRYGGGTIKATGQLGDVMKESTQIAYTVARARLAQLALEYQQQQQSKKQPEWASFFDTTDIHMHVPEGATPKDGPSAGITMVTSMLSLALNKPVRNDVAMTGEISLTGKVLPVGGIKEKIMAARRAGITHVILPDSNRRDYDEIPEYLKDGLTVHYADHYDKVYEVAF